MPHTQEGGIGYRYRDTSEEAARSMVPTAKTLRAFALNAINGAPHGLTADEVAARLGVSPLAIRPRITELNQDGKIVAASEKRRNESGRRAQVWLPAGLVLS